MPAPRASQLATAEAACIGWECLSALLFASAIAPSVTTTPWPSILFVTSLGASALLAPVLSGQGPGRLAAGGLVRGAAWAISLAPVVDQTGARALLAAGAFGVMASGVRRGFYRKASDLQRGDGSDAELRGTLRDRLAESATVAGIVAGHILMLFLVAFLRTTNELVRQVWWQVLPWLALAGTLVFTIVVRASTGTVLAALEAGRGGDPALLASGLRRAVRLPGALSRANFAVWLACATIGAFGFRALVGWSLTDAAIVGAIGVLFAWAISFYQRAWHRAILAPAVERLRAWTGLPIDATAPTLRRRMLIDFGVPFVFSATLSLLASVAMYRALVGELGSSPREILALVGSFVVLVVAAGWLIARAARELSSPMSTLAGAADRVARGDLGASVPRVEGPAEVAGLGESIERMRIALARTIAELEAEREGLEEKVTARTSELVRALEELKQAQAAALHAEKMASLGQLVAGIAHEINNPLNAIAGSVEPLAGLAADTRRALAAHRAAAKDLPPARQAELEKLAREIDLDGALDDLAGIAAVSRRASDRAVRIVADLLSFSRASTDRVPTNLHEGIDESLSLLGADLRRAGIAVEKAYGELPEVLVRPGELNQIFLNLLTNALSAVDGRSSPTIRVESRRDAGWVEVAIEDSGPGVPEPVRTRIFDPFFTTKPAGKGTGLGLSISSQIAARHGGTLSVEPSALGGARFVLRLPEEHTASGSFPSPARPC